jgi:hypothetical protein
MTLPTLNAIGTRLQIDFWSALDHRVGVLSMGMWQPFITGGIKHSKIAEQC